MHVLVDYFDFILHIDKHLLDIVNSYHTWTYLILALIIFCETGLVVTPLLPGDSLLFAAGALAGAGSLDIGIIIALLFVAAFIGDNTNYFIGNYIGPKVFDKNYKFLKKKYLEKTQHFYDKHGGKTIIIARFMPIIRTFAPFVAGVGTMKYRKFIGFSLLGNFLWITSFSLAGYLFGNIEIVKRNFTLVIFAIIFISILPPIIAVLKQKMSNKKAH